MNAIFWQVVNQRGQELQKEKCCGCKIEHPSQRRHECLMMTEEEGWITYGLEAIEHVVEKGILNLGPRVFSDKAADEDPGKIHFIFPKFWGKKRMRSEAQRMLLIIINAGAYYF